MCISLLCFGGKARFLFKSQVLDWNVNLSPLDGAVVGMREKRRKGGGRKKEKGGGMRWGGGTSLYADVNKNSHFQPVCALTDHSKHYAQHRGRTTLDYSTEIIFFSPSHGERLKTMRTKTPLQVFLTIQCCLHIMGVARISVSCLVITIPKSVSRASATAHLVSFHDALREGRGGGEVSFVRVDFFLEKTKQ